ncbi:MAG: hypothetical protein R3F46_11990 [bacterium]
MDEAPHSKPDPASEAPPLNTADQSITSGQLMCALQMGIFLPFLGPLIVLAVALLNRQHKDFKLIMYGALSFFLLQLAAVALLYGYVMTNRAPVPGN